jgi:hypothetical protein
MTIQELLKLISKWYLSDAKPNESRSYYKCSVCGQRWLADESQRHTSDCWIEQLRKSGGVHYE